MARNLFSRNPAGPPPEGRQQLHWIGLALVALIVAFISWLGIQTLSVKSDLENARTSAQQVKDTLIQGKPADASRWADEAVRNAQSARSTTHSGPWSLVAALPALGDPFKAGQQISDVVAGLASDLLRPAATEGIALSPGKLYQGGRIDVQLLRQQEPELAKLSASATRLQEQAAAITPSGSIAPIDKARSQLQIQTSEIASLLHNTTLAAQVGPSMMGADGPRTYLMAFQTNAEARGTGGLLGGFGILRFDNGKPAVETLGSNAELYKATADVDLGPEFNQLYGASRPLTDVRNSNQSAHFPYAAQIWQSMWERQSDNRVDGVIALDPVALSYLLAAEGPVTLPDGRVVNADNVVELTESEAYRMFPTDQEARKEYLQVISNAVVRKMTGEIKSPGKLLEALGRAASERRIMIWSAFPAEQEILEGTTLGHTIPDDAQPYAQVVINNYGGNKMDYYLKREIQYTAGECEGDARTSMVSVRLSNTATDLNLGDYVAGLVGLPPDLPFKIPRGSQVSSVRLLATQGAVLESVMSNGKLIMPTAEAVERGHPSFEVQVVIPPGHSGELTFQLSEPTTAGAPRAPIQPLIDSPIPVVSVPECT